MTLALLALLLVQINFGILPIAQKLALSTLTPTALFTIRSLAGAIAFQLALRLWRRTASRGHEETAPLPAGVYLGLSFLGIFLNQFLLIVALTLTSAIAAVIVVPSITLFTYLFAVLLKREAFTWNRAGILMLGGTGVFILFSDSLLHLLEGMDRAAFFGNLLCLLSAAIYAYYLVISRDYINGQPALLFTSRMFSWALVWTSCLVLGGLAWFALQNPSLSLWHFFVHESPRIPAPLTEAPQSGTVIAMLTFIVAGPTVLNYFLNLWSLKRLPASTVSGFICLQTLIGAGLSHLVLGEEMRPSYFWAGACILVSVVLLSLRSFRNPSSNEAHEANPRVFKPKPINPQALTHPRESG
jgi:drug/metabolite transporter (DMT)-like permease